VTREKQSGAGILPASGRDARSTVGVLGRSKGRCRTRTILHLALVLLVAAMPLAGCGKKGQPAVPDGEKSSYPHPYPVAAPSETPPADPAPDAAAAAPKPSEPAADGQAKP
jgi:predicted small lipoprotein YifL